MVQTRDNVQRFKHTRNVQQTHTVQANKSNLWYCLNGSRLGITALNKHRQPAVGLCYSLYKPAFCKP